MSPRTFVSFNWSEPDEDKLGEQGEVTTPGGKRIIEAIRSAMKQRGFTVTDVDQHESYGWYFETQVEDLRVWSMLQFSNPWLLITKTSLGFVQKLKGRNSADATAKVCQSLHQCLTESTMASAIQWFTREDFQRLRGQNGASSP